MSQYILRLDDASDYMDVKKWQRMEELLDQYGIKPLVGVIPDNRDSSLTDTYEQDPEFWDKTARWKKKAGSWHFMVAITSTRPRKAASTR